MSQEFLATTSISTRTMVAADLRRSTIAGRLTCECFKWMLMHGVRTDFCDVFPSGTLFTTGLGYKLLFDDFYHPEYGLGSVMRLDLYDLERLVNVRSPLRRILAKWLAEGERMAASLTGSGAK
jgi:hypothetical protein